MTEEKFMEVRENAVIKIKNALLDALQDLQESGEIDGVTPSEFSVASSMVNSDLASFAKQEVENEF